MSETTRTTNNRGCVLESALARDMLSQLAAAKAAIQSGDREAGVEHINIVMDYVSDVDALAAQAHVAGRG